MKLEAKGLRGSF